jgi:hypothetical protein
VPTIACKSELCAADDHEATTPEEVRHQRVTSDEDADHRIVATWTGTQYEVANEQVQMTYDGSTVVLTPREAVFWSRLMTTGTMWTPAPGFGTDTSAIAIDLATAAEVLLLLDGEADHPIYGHLLGRAVADAIDGYFYGAEEDEEANA